MRASPWSLGVLLAAVVAAAAIVAFGRPTRSAPPSVETPARPIVAEASFTRAKHLFGDRTVARLDLTVDQRAVDPETVSVQASLDPYELAMPVERTQHDVGRVTLLRYRFHIWCVSRRCVSAAPVRDFGLGPARISYERPRGGRAVERVFWPPVQMSSRVSVDEARRPTLAASLAALPDVSYRVDPDLVWRGLVLASVALFLLAGAALAYYLWHYWVALQRARGRRLSPLEQALALVRRSLASRSPKERRKALERLAGELRASGRPDLARAARTLAWSRTDPEPSEARAFCVDVERTIAEGV